MKFLIWSELSIPLFVRVVDFDVGLHGLCLSKLERAAIVPRAHLQQRDGGGITFFRSREDPAVPRCALPERIPCCGQPCCFAVWEFSLRLYLWLSVALVAVALVLSVIIAFLDELGFAA
jgi:hypothetical protein